MIAPGLWENLGDWRHTQRFDHAAAALARRLLQVAVLPPHPRLLDVGVGAGAQLGVWSTDLSPTSILALEPDPDRAVAARTFAKSLSTPCSVERAAASALSVINKPFDAILALDCIYHFPKRDVFLREARRLLFPQGVFAFTDLALTRPLRSFEERCWHALARACAIPPQNILTLREHRARLDAAGFDQIEHLSIGADVFPGFCRCLRTDPGLRARLRGAPRVAARFAITTAVIAALWRRRALDYLVVRAVPKSIL